MSVPVCCVCRCHPVDWPGMALCEGCYRAGVPAPPVPVGEVPVVIARDTDENSNHESDVRIPPRGDFSPETVKAIRTIHSVVAGQPYEPGEGFMHWAGGPYWRGELLRLANQWERYAHAARVCAEELPDA